MVQRARRIVVSILLIAGILAPASGGSAASRFDPGAGGSTLDRWAAAQESEPAPDLETGLPDRVSLALLASAEATAWAANAEHGTTTLRLERITLEPKARLRETAVAGVSPLSSQYIQGSSLLFVETGEVVIEFEEGEEQRLGTGQQLFVPFDPAAFGGGSGQEGVRAISDLHNDSETACAAILRLTYGTMFAQGFGSATTPLPLECGASSVLFEGTDPATPSASMWLFIAQATWQGSSPSDMETVSAVENSGTIGLLVESGMLTLTETGPWTGLNEGGWIVIPAGQTSLNFTVASESATALMAGVVPAGEPLMWSTCRPPNCTPG